MSEKMSRQSLRAFLAELDRRGELSPSRSRSIPISKSLPAWPRSEPLDHNGTIGKLGIDALRKADDRADWDLARPPEAARAPAKEILQWS
jgi:hypothetical protein